MTNDEGGGFTISFTKDGVVHFDKYTVADYVKSLNGMVKQMQDSQVLLRQIETRINCIRNEIENISPKAD